MADLGKRWLTETDRDLWRETVDMIQAGDSRVSHDTGELGGIVDSYIRARGGNVTPEQYTEHHRQEEREAEEAKYQARRALDKLQDAAERVEHWRQLTMFPDIVVPD